MHEFSIAQEIISLAEDELIKANGTKVFELQLKIGKISGVVPEALEFAFPVAAKGSKLENCKFSIIEVPVEIECQSCLMASQLEEFNMICPICASPAVVIKKGKEIQITSMEIE